MAICTALSRARSAEDLAEVIVAEAPRAFGNVDGGLLLFAGEHERLLPSGRERFHRVASEAARGGGWFERETCVAVPLVARGERVGALFLGFDGPPVIHPEERELILAFAQQCSLTLERVGLGEALETSRQSGRAVFAHALDAMVIADDEGRYVDVNPAACQLFGLCRDQLLGRQISDFAATEFALAAGEAWETFLFEGSQRGSFTICRPDGETRDTEFSATARIAPGQHLSILRDVTGRRRAEERLNDERRVVETLNRISPSLAAELDLDRLAQLVIDELTQVTRARVGAFRYFAVGLESPETRLCTQATVPPEVLDPFPLPKRPADQAPLTTVGVLRVSDITSDSRYALVHPESSHAARVRSYLAAPVTSRSGEVLGAIFLGHDRIDQFSERDEKILIGIAAQAAVAIDNARLFTKAQEAVRARDEFLQVASHELLTPLTSLKLQLQRLLRASQDPLGAAPAHRAKLEAAHRQTDRLDKLIRNLLDISRITTHKLVLARERVDLRELLEKIASRFEVDLNSAGCHLSLEVKPGVVGEWDRLRMDQVFSNLVANAVKYGATRPITLSAQAVRGDAVVSVADQGIGVAPKDQARIFQRFERAVSERHYGGLGLGLWIARQIVIAHGGEIAVQSAPGEGSRFIVRLPLAAAKA